jgi:phosphomannomutase
VSDPAAIFKAYDIRGVVPDQLDEELARSVGSAFVAVAADSGAVEAVAVGHDMRPSSPGLATAFAEGVNAAGADVISIGLASTDELYFASGYLDVPGAMFTASHNPAKYNGIKLCRRGATPVGVDTGLTQIREGLGSTPDVPAEQRGTVEERDLLSAYAKHLHELVPVQGRRLKVVVDAANGMAGHTVPAVFAGMDVELVSMYFELDGTFPNHEANPIDPANLADLMAAVPREGADLGLAFDGDADRCFVIDERGEIVTPSTLTALIAVRELDRVPGSAIIHNLITSRAVAEIVREHGGTAVRTRVGHSYIKARMAETDAVFGGEHSGHFYFRDFWRADSGMLAALHTLAALAGTDKPLSSLLTEFERYAASGEINSTVGDQQATMATVQGHYADRSDVSIDHLDGLSVEHADWWFNVRPSNTEPLLRLNAEGVDEATMAEVRDTVLGLIKGAA